MTTLCGVSPKKSTEAAIAYLKETANDPQSVEIVECRLVGGSDEDCWEQSCRFRERNRMGAMVIRRGSFFVTKGKVVRLQETKDVG